MPEIEESLWWTRLEKIENLRQKIEVALCIPNLTDRNRERLEVLNKRLDEREATARFMLGLPYTPPNS